MTKMHQKHLHIYTAIPNLVTFPNRNISINVSELSTIYHTEIKDAVVQLKEACNQSRCVAQIFSECSEAFCSNCFVILAFIWRMSPNAAILVIDHGVMEIGMEHMCSLFLCWCRHWCSLCEIIQCPGGGQRESHIIDALPSTYNFQ